MDELESHTPVNGMAPALKITLSVTMDQVIKLGCNMEKKSFMLSQATTLPTSGAPPTPATVSAGKDKTINHKEKAATLQDDPCFIIETNKGKTMSSFVQAHKRKPV